MNRQDLLLGTCMYALTLAAGLSGPILKKMSKLPWDRPADKIVQDLLPTSVPTPDQKVKKSLLASRVPPFLSPNNSVPASDLNLNATSRELGENWKGIASSPVIAEPGPKLSRNISPFFGKKSGVKLTPVSEKKKALPNEEPTKG